MRKNVLALSIATMIGGLGIAGAAFASVIPGTGPVNNATMGVTNASALQLAPGGIGHILVVPYFTAQNGNATVLSLVNTDETNGKAIKVRFRGASNSDDILDFTLLMSPGDVWNGLVNASNPNAIAAFSTTDKTCTIPPISASGQPFVTNRIDPQLSASDIAKNTREGYIEIFNMADIPPLTGTAASTSNSALYNTIKHNNGVAACDGTVLTAALFSDTAVEATAASRGLATPTTGLLGNWTIINVPLTTTFTGSATAVRALSGFDGLGNGLDGRGNYVLFPQTSTTVVGPDAFTADPSLRVNAFTSKDGVGVTAGLVAAPVIPAAFFDLPDLSTPYITNAGLQTAIAASAFGSETAPRAQASILTTALAVSSIKNEYTTEPSVTGATDWVFSMPTRRYSVALSYGTTASRVFSVVPVNNNAGTGTAQFFFTGNTTVTARQICVNSDGQKFFDREETTKTSGFVFSPGSISVTQFCGETSVLSFGVAGLDSVLSATVAAQQTGGSAFVNGWGTVATANNGTGLPILGSAFIRLKNPLVSAGVSGTYGITLDHRFTK
jgi:hypothetical protein